MCHLNDPSRLCKTTLPPRQLDQQPLRAGHLASFFESPLLSPSYPLQQANINRVYQKEVAFAFKSNYSTIKSFLSRAHKLFQPIISDFRKRRVQIKDLIFLSEKAGLTCFQNLLKARWSPQGPPEPAFSDCRLLNMIFWSVASFAQRKILF